MTPLIQWHRCRRSAIIELKRGCCEVRDLLRRSYPRISEGGGEMAKVIGLEGLFFLCQDVDATRSV